MKKISLAMFSFFVTLTACAGPDLEQRRLQPRVPNNVFQIDQAENDAGTMVGDDNDGGAVDTVSVSDDTRVAVAYCAAAVVDTLPKRCDSMTDEHDQLHTVCDTGLEIAWNCEKCGDIIKDDKQLGHLIMHSDTLFQINPLSTKAAYICELADDGVHFTVKPLQ